MATPNNKRTIALIPCYNEAATIQHVIQDTKPYVTTILVVDDGSTDQTATLATHAGATVLIHKNNQGKSAAIKTGFKYALDHNYDCVITLDGDGQHNPKEIPNVLNKVLNDGHDIAIGVRYGHTTEMPFWRKIGKRMLDYATSVSSNGILTDSQCGFRAFSNKAIQGLIPHMNGSSFAAESEQIIKASDIGLAIGNARVSCKYRDLDTSTRTPASHGISVLSYVLWLTALRRPLLFIGIPGSLLILLGIYISLNTLTYYTQTQFINYTPLSLGILLQIIGTLIIILGLKHNILPILKKRAQQKKHIK